MSQSKTKYASGFLFILRFELRLVFAKSHSTFKANFIQSKVSELGQIKRIWQFPLEGFCMYDTNSKQKVLGGELVLFC